MTATKSALQVTEFNFYGDSLVALRDNVSGEIYAGINSVLRGLGFADAQIRYQRDKWTKDISISKGVLKFSIPTNGGYQSTECINSRKLPLALAKINITKRMLRDYPDITHKLELYQDKCSDVLASVFIDKKTTSEINMQPLIDTIVTLTSSIVTLQQEVSDLKAVRSKSGSHGLPKKSFSRWTSKMFPKYQLLIDYFDVSWKELYHNLYIELQNTYPDIDLRQEQDDYCFENGLESCFTLDVIEHNKMIRKLFESVVDNLLDRYNISYNHELLQMQRTIFDC